MAFKRLLNHVKSAKRISRSASLVGMMAGLGSAFAPVAHAADIVVVNRSGGAIDEAYKACFWDEFTKETGIVVQSVGNASQTLAGLKAQVSSGNVEWDLTEIYDTEFGTALQNDLQEKLDLANLPTASWDKLWYNDYGVW